MSDEEEESLSEAFSASEDDWKPTRGGESSDDDDSDFEDAQATAAGGAGTATSGGGSRKREPKGRSAVKQDATAAKKRKPMGQSLRTKLYNKYRPPPKTVSSPTSRNSPSASTSRTASKNCTAPNESSDAPRRDNDSSSESSVEDYLVNPADIDFQSSFFNADGGKAASPAPTFDCSAGMAHLSDSEDDNESSEDEEGARSKAFDFRNLLEKANSLERVKETIAKRAAQTKTEAQRAAAASDAMDVNTLLALGEMQKENTTVGIKTGRRLMKKNDKDDDEDDDDDGDKGKASKKKQFDVESGSQRFSKTKSTRVKRRQAKTRPASTVIAGDSDDSLDWEEVAGHKQIIKLNTNNSLASIHNLCSISYVIASKIYI